MTRDMHKSEKLDLDRQCMLRSLEKLKFLTYNIENDVLKWTLAPSYPTSNMAAMIFKRHHSNELAIVMVTTLLKSLLWKLKREVGVLFHSGT